MEVEFQQKQKSIKQTALFLFLVSATYSYFPLRIMMSKEKHDQHTCEYIVTRDVEFCVCVIFYLVVC